MRCFSSPRRQLPSGPLCWAVNNRLKLFGGLRLENYPLMSHKDRGIERLDYANRAPRLRHTLLRGGLGEVPELGANGSCARGEARR